MREWNLEMQRAVRQALVREVARLGEAIRSSREAGDLHAMSAHVAEMRLLKAARDDVEANGEQLLMPAAAPKPVDPRGGAAVALLVALAVGLAACGPEAEPRCFAEIDVRCGPATCPADPVEVVCRPDGAGVVLVCFDPGACAR